MHLGSQPPLKEWLLDMHEWHLLVANDSSIILYEVSGELLAEHAHAVPRHPHGLQKQLLLLL